MNLTWAVDDQILILISAQLLFQPIHILLQVSEHAVSMQNKTCADLATLATLPMAKRVENFTHSLETVHQTTIGTVVKLGHDVLQAD